MADISEKQMEQLRALRALGVKSVGFFEGDLAAVEFFPRELLDLDSLVPGAADTTPTDRPPPALDEDGPALRVPPAIAAILKRGSVS